MSARRLSDEQVPRSGSPLWRGGFKSCQTGAFSRIFLPNKGSRNKGWHVTAPPGINPVAAVSMLGRVKTVGLGVSGARLFDRREAGSTGTIVSTSSSDQTPLA